MRRSIVLGFAALIVAFCLLAVPSGAGVVAVSSAHTKVTVPSGWNFQRNYTSSGLTYDLYITSPVSTSGQVIGMFGHEVASGSVTADELYQEVRSELESGGFAGVTYVVAPRNITIDDLPACDVTISANAGLVSVNERVTIVFSKDWHQSYIFIFAVVSTAWSSFSSDIDSTIMSLSVEEKSGGGAGSSSLFVMIGAIVVVVAVVVVVVLLMMRKKSGPVPGQPGQTSPMPPSPPPPPPTH